MKTPRTGSPQVLTLEYWKIQNRLLISVIDPEERQAAFKAIFEGQKEVEITEQMHDFILKKEKETGDICNKYYQVKWVVFNQTLISSRNLFAP